MNEHKLLIRCLHLLHGPSFDAIIIELKEYKRTIEQLRELLENSFYVSVMQNMSSLNYWFTNEGSGQTQQLHIPLSRCQHQQSPGEKSIYR